MSSLGRTVRRLRKEAGLTQHELASRIGITKSFLSRIENDRRNPSLDTLRRVASALSVWPGLLLGAFVQTEMPEEVRETFEAYLDEIVRTRPSEQLPLPLTDQ